MEGGCVIEAGDVFEEPNLEEDLFEKEVIEAGDVFNELHVYYNFTLLLLFVTGPALLTALLEPQTTRSGSL